MLRSRFLLSLLFCSPSLFADGVVIRPAGPTTRTPVEIRYFSPCPIGDVYSVSVTGNVVKLHFEGVFCAVDPPIAGARGVLLPTLLATGEYRVEVTAGATDAIRASTTFVVRNADPNAPFEVHPFAVPGHLLDRPRVRISRTQANSPLCFENSCRLFAGGVEVADKRVDAEGNLWFTPPPHEPGLVSIEVRRAGDPALAMAGALYYFDRSAPAPVSVFEPILFPIVTSTPGANGSLWRTEAAILNPKPWFVESYNEILPFHCIDYPCGERLAAGERVAFEGGDYPRGVALLVPRNEAPALSFALRARDVSRQAEDFGTAIPVVREHDMYFNRMMTMLDVPVEPRYRVKARVYALPPADLAGVMTVAFVTIVRADGTRTETPLMLQRDCTTLTCAQTPLYAELDLPPGAAGERVDVYVDGMQESLSWSFITVTNNDTQQVTIVTPDGKGGRP